MRKGFLRLVCLIIICFTMLQQFDARAAESNTEVKTELVLHYQKEGNVFPDLEIGIYHVANLYQDDTFQLLDPFSSYPVNLNGITTQERWNDIAQTLYSYIVTNQVEPKREEKTDANGTARFTELETGLYLVRQVIADSAEGEYLFDSFMLYVPASQPDGKPMEAKPKCTGFVPKTQYTVIKLWQGEENKNIRPKSVIADLYKNGLLYETQILSAENNWMYTWYVDGEAQAIWTVSERNVPDAYKVVIREKDGVFSIINTYSHSGNNPGGNPGQNKPVTPPQTGDTFMPLLWIIGMCLSGIILLILGYYSRRRK